MSSTDQLDHLESQAKILLEYIEAKRKGRKVKVEWYSHAGWKEHWDFEVGAVDLKCSYRLIYTEEKRVPKKGDKILVKLGKDAHYSHMTVSNWYNHYIDVDFGETFLRLKPYEFEWKWPDDPSPEKVEESPTITKAKERIVEHYKQREEEGEKIEKKLWPLPSWEDAARMYDQARSKKLVPLEAKDWVGGVWWIKKKEWLEGFYMVIGVSKNLIVFNTINDELYPERSNQELMEQDWLRSRDCISWTPCSKESEEV